MKRECGKSERCGLNALEKRVPQRKPSQRRAITSHRACSHPPHLTWMGVSRQHPKLAVSPEGTDQKSASSTTSQQCAPSPVPCSSCCRPDGPRLRPGFGPRETCDEAASFIRPASTHFTRQHNKARSAMLACQFWVGQLFATSSLRQSGSIKNVTLAAGGCRQHAMLTPWWCPLPTAPRGTVATRQQ